jgi:hypothetical protein
MRMDWNTKLVEALVTYWNSQGLDVPAIMLKQEFVGASSTAVRAKIEHLQMDGVLARHGRRNNIWPPGLAEVAMAYWNAGVSAGKILTKPEFIGAGFTKNAIIGKIHRTPAKDERRAGPPSELRVLSHEQRVHNAKKNSPETWPTRPKETAADRRARYARSAQKRRDTIALKKARNVAVEPKEPGVGWFDHADDACRFIVHGTGMEALWCPEPKSRGSYCAYHAAICTHKVA